MKFLLIVGLWALAIPNAFAQTDTARLLMDGGKRVLTGVVPVSDGEREEVLAVLGPWLERQVSFRDDGSASSAHHFNKRVTHIEWRGFKIHRLTRDGLVDADKANGITRRYLAGFSCTSHRTWDATNHRWSDWKPFGYAMFPSGITIEEKNGVLSVRATEQGEFRPGPGRAVPVVRPAPKGVNDGLPPGMQRVKR